MRRVMLSHPLPVFGLVSRYLTNYLIGYSLLLICPHSSSVYDNRNINSEGTY